MASETKHEKFIRLAEARVPKALDTIRLVGQLSSNNYENEPDEAEEIVTVLRDAVSNVAELFGIPNAETAAALDEAEAGQTEPVEEEPEIEEVHQPEEPEVVFPPPIRFTSEEMRYQGPIDADDIRSALQLLTYSKDIEGAVRVLRNSLKDSPQ